MRDFYSFFKIQVNMKKFYLIFMLLAMSYCGISQSLSHDVIGTAGGENAQLSWTMGELATMTFTSTNEILTQGFQQAELIRVSTRNWQNDFQVSAYPNPFDQFVNIEKDTQEELLVECVDLLGRVLHQERLTDNVQSIDLSQLASSIYFLKIYNQNGQFIHLIKIQKK